MPNIFDYLKWRDIEIQKVEFNEVDNLILSRLAYFPFDGLIKDDEKITIKECFFRYQTIGTSGRILQKEDIDLFPMLANSKRFGQLYITKFINKIDIEQEKQFSAITIVLPDDTIYVAYRGTDTTIIGWKEDLYMSFCDLVPSQVDAVSYLEYISKKFKKLIRVGGHSKGGNLAVYASAFSSKKIQDKIINIYNNDGPGFQERVIESEGYRNIISKVHTYIPQTSIIGRLLNHKEKTTILKSTQTGIMQHDLYSWQVLGDKFIEAELTTSSELIDQTITKWLVEVDSNQRKRFIDALFEILNSTKVITFNEIGNQWFKNAKTILKTYSNLDKETKKMMIKTFNELLKIGKDNIKLRIMP